MRLRIYPISTSRTPSRLLWFRTISTPTERRHCMKPFRPLRRGGSSSDSSGTTLPNTSYAGFWVTRRSGGVVCRHLDDLDAVLKSDTCDDLRQLICSFQPSPSF